MLAGIGLTKAFGGHVAVKDVSVSVKPGAATVILGPNGAGKTITLRLLAQIDAPTHGVIHVDKVTYEYPRLTNGPLVPKPWPEVTAVFQQLFLWPHLTIRQNIALPLAYRRLAHQHEVVDQLISDLELERFAHRRPNQVSLGERQRAALARALALQPRYILLDEITSALDVEQIATILALLTRLRDQGIGLLVVTHLLSFAERIATTVIFLDNGSVVESGGPEVLRAPKSTRLLQFLDAVREAR